jgi:hypothetical protein
MLNRRRFVGRANNNQLPGFQTQHPLKAPTMLGRGIAASDAKVTDMAIARAATRVSGDHHHCSMATSNALSLPCDSCGRWTTLPGLKVRKRDKMDSEETVFRGGRIYPIESRSFCERSTQMARTR